MGRVPDKPRKSISIGIRLASFMFVVECGADELREFPVAEDQSYFRIFDVGVTDEARSPAGPYAELDALNELNQRAREMKRESFEPNTGIRLGLVFFAQLVSHDLSFMTGVPRGGPIHVSSLNNLRSPLLDLDSIYGGGPGLHPYLYVTDPVSGQSTGELITGENVAGEPDLPRAGERRQGGSDVLRFRRAIIGDLRNDETFPLSQLTLGVLRFHNAEVRRLRERGQGDLSGMNLYRQARRETTWTVQWLVVNELIPALCGEVATEISPTDFKLMRDDRISLPVEFVLACYRVGHAMAPQRFHLNKIKSPKWLMSHRSSELVNYANGGRDLPPGWTVQWDLFVPTDGGEPQPSATIEQKVASALFQLPGVPGASRNRALAFRTLAKGYRAELPSGQALAEFARAKGIEIPEREGNDPLWLYILGEALDHGSGGTHLGPLGAQVVMEVLKSRISADEHSYLSEDGWSPRGHSAEAPFSLATFLERAGMPMTKSDVLALQSGG